MPKRFYAVKKGAVPGVYDTWEDCQKNTKGFSGAVFKGFATIEEADRFMREDSDTVHAQNDEELQEAIEEPYAYVDGSYNQKYKIAGYSVILHADKKKFVLSGMIEDTSGLRNILGEVQGALKAAETAVMLGLDKLTIIHDYTGIANWADGSWATNNDVTCDYAAKINQYMYGGLHIDFVHVNGHTGVAGNEEADRAAKASVGVK